MCFSECENYPPFCVEAKYKNPTISRGKPACLCSGMAQTFFTSTPLPCEKWFLMFKHSLNVRDEWYYIFSVFHFQLSHHLDWTLAAFTNVLSAIMNIVEICTTFVHCGWDFDYTDKSYLAVWEYYWKPNFIDKINRRFLIFIHIYCLGKTPDSIVINSKLMFILSKMISRIQLGSWMSFPVNCDGWIHWEIVFTVLTSHKYTF